MRTTAARRMVMKMQSWRVMMTGSSHLRREAKGSPDRLVCRPEPRTTAAKDGDEDAELESDDDWEQPSKARGRGKSRSSRLPPRAKAPRRARPPRRAPPPSLKGG